MEILAKIFGTEAKVKIMRLFLLNPGEVYDSSSVVDRSKAKPAEVKKELVLLTSLGLIDSKRMKTAKGKVLGFSLNENFIYLKQLQELLVNTLLFKESDIVKRLAKAGKVKMVVLAGVFLQNWESRADLLVVGDKIKESKLASVVHKMESEIGKELRYAILDTADFQYRMSVGDKLVRDVFDFQHKVILDKLGVEQRNPLKVHRLSTVNPQNALELL